MCILSASMWVHHPWFNDATIPIALYGAVGAITLGGMVLMRRPLPAEQPGSDAGQRLQAKVGIGLGMLSFMLVYVLLKLAQPIPLSPH